MATSTTLVNNLTITTPRTSPGVNLSASGGTWTAKLDMTAHAGSAIDFTVQSSPDNNAWVDVSNNSLLGADGTGKFGQDISHQVLTFGLYGVGPWWRSNVTRVVGTILVNSLTVSNV